MSGKLIGITGYAESGKDELAKSLLLRGGYMPMAMSDALREMALILDPILTDDGKDYYSLSTVVLKEGYTESKRHQGVRQYLQVLGTDAVRNILGEDSWVAAAERKFIPHLQEERNVCVTGIRFPNEVNMIKRYGGTMIKVIRDGTGPVNSHVSDAIDTLPVDVVVFNNGTLQDLANEAQKFLNGR